VAVLGRAQALLSSFAARPGQQLIMAVDLRGQWEGAYPFWNASTRAPSDRLRGDLALLPEIAEDGLSACAKDISMAGILGTALMLLECSQVGAHIRLDAIPHPPGHGPLDAPEAWLRWLQAFPSFGYLLSVDAAQVAPLQARFAARGLACAVIGELDASGELWLEQAAGVMSQPVSAGAGASAGNAPERALLWDLNRAPFIGPRHQLEAAA